MATLRTAVALYDGVTSPLQHMTTAMNIVINSFEHMQTASGNSIDTAALQTARSELARASTAFDSIENNIRQSDQQQQRFNSDIRSGTTAADGLWSKIKGYVSAFTGLYAAQKTLGLSDTLAQTSARLSLVVDDGGSVDALQKKIMASANSARANYVDVGKTVSKLGILAGDAFSGNDEMVKFTELLNKNFVIGGASLEEQTASMYQLTQAMASGRLQGDEFRSIRENAPLLAKAIEDYMTDAGVPGTLKDWSAQGLITADVIKNAMFQSADEVDARFAEMPMTWAQRWTLMKNKAIQVFQPILTKINQVANSERFNTVFDGIVRGLATIAAVAAGVFSLMITIGSGIVDNWSWIGPIIYGVVAALIVFNMISGITSAALAIQASAQNVVAAAAMLHSGATIAETAAQYGLNAALYACPIVWIIAAVLAVIVIIALLIQWIAKATGHTVSAVGIIAGIFAVAGAVIYNIIIMVLNVVIGAGEGIFNVLKAIGNFFANFLVDPVGSVIHLIGDMVNAVLTLLGKLASVIDTIFGTDLQSGVEKTISWVEAKTNSLAAKYGNGQYEAIFKATNVDTLKTLDLGSVWNSAYGWGSSIQDKFSSLTGSDLSDYNSTSDLGDTASNTADTAANTAAMKDSLATSEENLKYLREIAERQAIDQYTTAEINLVMQNENHISSDADLDGIINELEKRTEEAILEVSEGVHV